MKAVKKKTMKPRSLAIFTLVMTLPLAAVGADHEMQWDPRFFKNNVVLMDAARQAVAAERSRSARGYRAAAHVRSLHIPEPVSTRLLSATGGEVRRSDRAGVLIPPNALAQNLDIRISHPDVTDEAVRKAKAVEKGRAQASLPVAFGPEGAAFSAPVTITIPYDSTLVASQGMREEDLKVHHWSTILQAWEALQSRVDTSEHLVSAKVLHFSVYQVLGVGGSGIGVAAAEVSLGFKAAYVFPNPVRGQSTVTIRVQPGLADSVEVRVYDLADRKIHASSSFNNRGAFDDGNGLGPQFTYDHVWDVSGVGSGVYTYIVMAKKAGQADIVKSGKVAVVK